MKVMENNFRERQQKNFNQMRRARDISMGLFILLIGILMFAAEKVGLALTVDPVIRYLFGGLCLLYGGFRLYRGIKRDY
ncbi:MAG: hypothetical protein ABJA79_01115 [Parafilimonas sp.]